MQDQQDRYKFRYVFTKDFAGKTGICYKMPIFDLKKIIDNDFAEIIKSYTDYDYRLVSKDQCTGKKDRNNQLIFENDIVKIKIKGLDNISENFEEYEEYEEYEHTFTGKIIFEDYAFSIEVIDDDNLKRKISLFVVNDIEVIGTKY